MKKLLLTAVILTIISGAVYSQESKEDVSIEVQKLIKKDLYDNFDLIQSKADNLTTTQKLFIYDDKKKGIGTAFFLNFIVGFGIGSWVQGHTTGGLIGTIGGIAGATMYYTGLARDNNGLATAGAIIYLGTYLTDLVLPFTFANSYNKTLKRALKLTDAAGIKDINISPGLNMTKDNTVYPIIKMSLAF